MMSFKYQYQCHGCGREFLLSTELNVGGCPKCGEPCILKAVSTIPPTRCSKTPFELLDLDFAAAMCENWAGGIKEGREANDWQQMEWDEETRQGYIGKTLRHLYRCINADTPEEAKKHAAAIACNANILWYYATNPRKQS